MGHEPVEEEEDWEAAAKKNLNAHTQKSYEKKKVLKVSLFYIE